MICDCDVCKETKPETTIDLSDSFIKAKAVE